MEVDDVWLFIFILFLFLFIKSFAKPAHREAQWVDLISLSMATPSGEGAVQQILLKRQVKL